MSESQDALGDAQEDLLILEVRLDTALKRIEMLEKAVSVLIHGTLVSNNLINGLAASNNQMYPVGFINPV